MIVDFSNLNPTQVYHLMTQSITPRPIAWILTENDADNAADPYNLAPFSYFNAVASNPPMVMVSIGAQPSGGPKDTLTNIQRTGKMVIHIASAHLLDALNQSSATLPYGESELSASQMTTEPFDGFELPKLISANIALACELDHIHLLDASPQTLVFAQIKTVFFDESITEQDQKGRLKINAEKLAPIARLGGNEYALLGELINKQRPA